MKSLLYKSSLLILAFSAVSCFSSDDRNYQYFPDMYVSEAYEAYGEYELFENNQEAMLPVEGSIPRGWMPFSYENSNEGYLAAKANLENPLPYTKENVAAGQQLFTIYCAVCHGDKGDGKGILAQREKILGVPAYNAPGRDITMGSAYYVMYYGLNTMGSYAAQTTEHERWQIAHYVMDLKRALNGESKKEFVTVEEMDEKQELVHTMDSMQGHSMHHEMETSAKKEASDDTTTKIEE
ncbi:MAG TPA: cytochrome c [Flavobacteriaceae bacterium]|nr:cytochrome c [Flavobacteriaceae bacterium]